MTTVRHCEAADPSQCTKPNCPDRRGFQHRMQAAAQAQSFDSFLAAAQEMDASKAPVATLEQPAKKPAVRKPSFASVKSVDDFKGAVKAKYPGVILSLSGNGQNGDFVTLGSIVIPKDQRNGGKGSAIMAELVKAADKNGWNLALTPDDFQGSSKTRLEVFYRRFGFRPNKGRSRDFMTKETMIRYA
jgi:GNAT superfamily N-acetyltransferase